MNYSWKKLDFDTALFGYPMAKIEKIESVAAITPLIADLKQNNIQYATARILTSDYQMVSSLQDNSFRLVDSLIAMELRSKDKDRWVDSPYVRAAKSSDKDSLFTIASESFMTNRFYADRFFSEKKEKIKELYGKWAENSLAGKAADRVFVYEEKNEVYGFVTVQNTGHIPLVAVKSNKRGKGVAKILLNAALSYLKKKDSEKAEIETVIMNIPALRSYLALGFKVTNSYFTFAWHNDDTHILH